MSHVKTEAIENHPASFRDPSGHVFEFGGILYRSVSKSYANDYDFLVNSGLAKRLFDEQMLVEHEETNVDLVKGNYHRIIKPQRLSFISYPYEWCFGQLKDAALLTLQIQKTALDHGMILKDASAFNVQFKNGYRPIFIDSLSFTIYQEGQSWPGYKQFCEHFLAPLCLSAYRGPEYLSIWKLSLEGVPLKMASQLLPWRTRFVPSVFLHIHLHSKSVELYSVKKRKGPEKERKIAKRNLAAMIDQLTNFVASLSLGKENKTQWQNYDQETHYSEKSKKSKSDIVQGLIAIADPKIAWDLGANDGFFSRLIAGEGRQVLSLDADPLAIEKNYGYAKEMKTELHPLIFTLANPTPSMGWANKERAALTLRSKPDLIMALALIHHITITHNVPFIEVARYFYSLAEWLIIEFVPVDDEKILSLPNTAGKATYNRENFDQGFLQHYKLISEQKIDASNRSLLLLKRSL